jgi:hypothetical protein
MRKYQSIAAIGLILLVAGFALLTQSPALAQDDTAEAGGDPPFLAAYFEAWSSSPHNRADDEAFRHWDADGEIEADCAKCHSTPGYLDYLGEDGSEFGVVEAAAPLGTTVNCDACHNPTAASLTTVTFPSGMQIETQDNAARCMECHQGRASGADVDAAIETAGLTDMNTPSDQLGFINIHYYAAAATLYGSEAAGGYQFPDQVYQMQNVHVPGYDTCTSCHNPHTLEVNVETCASCHDVESLEDLREIRMPGSQVDFDGDGDNDEGIADEIVTLQEMTYEAIQTYARNVAGTPIAYDAHAYPYWFNDTNDNGTIDEGEADFGNKYASFTGNLLKAAYNYQVSQKDPAGYAHNPVYHIQLLFDSIQVLNGELGEDGVELAQATRNESGHFDVTAEAFRHWDVDGEVDARCTKCHTAEGLPFFMENGVNIAAEPSNSLSCSTCHTDLSEFTLYTVNEVVFPSGAALSFGEEEESNLCLNCHQGRESTVSVNASIARAGVGDDEPSEDLSFRNIHYFAAGATLFGTEAKGAYEYDGKTYNGRFMHDERVETCDSCHREHELTVRVSVCEDCHDVEEQADLRLIRNEAEGVEPIDYNGNGDVEEPIAAEIDSLEADLLTKLQQYAAETVGTGIVYDAHSHPYWFTDSNGNGEADEEEVNGDNRYASWTPTLLRAAYNYQYIQKDPGVFVHNADYALQILYDSLEAIGGADAVANYTRPPVSESAS